MTSLRGGVDLARRPERVRVKTKVCWSRGTIKAWSPSSGPRALVCQGGKHALGSWSLCLLTHFPTQPSFTCR